MAEYIKIEMRRQDWEEVCYALEARAKQIENGELGPEESEGEDEDWIEHLKELEGYIWRHLETRRNPKPTNLSRGDQSRLVELAAKRTAKECRQRRIELWDRHEDTYTPEAQEIFNRIYDETEAELRRKPSGCHHPKSAEYAREGDTVPRCAICERLRR